MKPLTIALLASTGPFCTARRHPALTANLSSLTATTPPPATISIENCRNPTNFQLLIAQVQRTMQEAYHDSSIGTASRHGFASIFKTNDRLPLIRQTMSEMHLGTPITGLKPTPDTPTSPRFACANPGSAQQYRHLSLPYDPWWRCVEDPSDAPPLFYAPGTAYIFLCPIFASLAPSPLQGRCPAVVANRFAGDAAEAYQDYKVYAIIHELALFYLGSSALNVNTEPPETFDWNGCVVDLDAGGAARNAESLALYAFLVQNQCVQVPKPPGALLVNASTPLASTS